MEGIQCIKTMHQGNPKMTLHEFKKNVFCIIDSVQIGGEIFDNDLSKYDKYTVTKIYPYSTAIYNNKLNVTQIVNRLRVVLEPPKY